MKLIPLSEYVLQEEKTLDNILNENLPTIKIAESYDRIVNYTKFLRQPLTLSMFVPVDENGNVLTEPDSDNYEDGIVYYEKLNKYVEAKEKVLFEGFEVGYDGASIISVDPVSEDLPRLSFDKNDGDCRPYKTVEDLVQYGLPLTPSALKLIGVKEKE